MTLTGQYEESLGYRYFYSLRQLYDRDPYVFLPQGHLMDLANRCLQILLSALGKPPSSLFPRIDLFALLTLELAYALTALGFYMMARICRNWYEVVLVGLLAILPYLNQKIWGFNVLFQPDYPNWIAAFMLVAAALTIKAARSGDNETSGLRDYLQVSSLTAAALGIKATLVVYPVGLAIVLIAARRGFVRSVVMATASGLTGIFGWLLILLTYFNFHPTLVAKFFGDEAKFGSSVHPSLPYIVWLRTALAAANWMLALAVLLPFGIVCMPFVPRMRAKMGVVVGVFVGAVAYHCALYFRFQPVTWYESIAFSIFAVLIFLLLGADGTTGGFRTAAYVSLILGCMIASIPGSVYVFKDYTEYLSSLTEAQRAATEALSNFDDRIAFLLPENSYRPLTVDSDIWKGGSNILDGNKFGASPLIKTMFPHREYFDFSESWYAAHPLDLRAYRAVVFTIRVGIDEGRKGQLAFMRNRFHLLDKDLRIHDDIDFGSQRFLVWTHSIDPQETPAEQLDFTAARTSARVIELSWLPVKDESFFEIEMETGNQMGSKFVNIGRGGRESGRYVIGDVSPYSSYTFQIQRSLKGVRSLPSEPVSVPALER